MATSLKVCTASDIDTLRELSIKTFDETFAPTNTPENMKAYLDKAFTADKLYSELNDKNSLFLLLYSDEELAGYLKLNEAPSQTEINDEKALEVERIYVLGKFQGMGLGRYLLKTAIDTATKRQKEYIWLGVWEKNEKAQRFYKKAGFYKIGAHSFVMGDDPQTDYIMRLDLK